MPSFLYPSKGGRALRARGKQRRRRCTNAPPIFFPEKENGRRPSKRKAFRLAVSGLKGPLASGMQLPARGGAAFEAAIRLASASIIRCCAAVGGSAALRMRHTLCGCRSAHLVEVRSNSHYRQSPQCGERSNAAILQAVCRQANVTRASR